ncbi:hypothetical protein WM40_27280 [Robbsia andropogonis]|uniref:Uncharacterized protein n=1 Tax=Robbsia andropogonis TaxID=28092 RepID=A0A0F5JSY6_9BURK|nr:hypothetical protein WM40_27280 [Robbsia andropogonis]
MIVTAAQWLALRGSILSAAVTMGRWFSPFWVVFFSWQSQRVSGECEAVVALHHPIQNRIGNRRVANPGQPSLTLRFARVWQALPPFTREKTVE